MDAVLLTEARQRRYLYGIPTEDLLLELHLRDLDTKAELEQRFAQESPLAQLQPGDLEQLRREWLERARRDQVQEIRELPDSEIAARIEAKRYLAITFGTDELERQQLIYENKLLHDEVARRQRLREANAGDPTTPPAPQRDGALLARIEKLHQRFPIDRFCTELLGLALQRQGTNAKAPCPLPGHTEKTPSFVVFGESNRARCFGCNRGGDIFDLSMLIFGDTSIYDAVKRLERAA